MNSIDSRMSIIIGDVWNECVAVAIDVTVLESLESAQADGEPDLIVELIDLFLKDAPRRLANMSTFLEDGDLHSLSREAHCLKGSSATLGAPVMTEICQAVEDIVRDRPWEIARPLSDLHHEFVRVLEALSAERHNRLVTDSASLNMNPAEGSAT